MKLIESDRQGPLDDVDVDVDAGHADVENATPPRPEHRRVSVSLLFTLSVLAGTVVAIYLIVPERHNLLMTRSLEVHRRVPALMLENATSAELRAWGVALLGEDVPWPDPGPAVSVVGVSSLSVLNWPAAVVRYQVDDHPVTLVVQRARDAPPRKRRRLDGDDYVVSWRKGKWTFVAVGPGAHADKWTGALGVP